MAPFIEKRDKWIETEEETTYVNKGGYKYDIISKKCVKKEEDMPEFFLADTPKEAEEIYKLFEGTLNNFAYAYAVSTGLSKADLFGEALIGLARAYRDWDPERSESFKIYAIYRIKDSLREFIRRNITSMSIPSYIQKAYLNVNEIKIICEMHDVDYRLVLKDQEIPDELSVSSAVRCAKLVNNLIKASNRAKISYNKFVDRIELIPEETDFSSDILYDPYKEEEKHMEAALVVEKLKKFMDEEELRICDGIMLDKTYDEIGSEMGKSKAWVAGKIESLRERILYVVNK